MSTYPELLRALADLIEENDLLEPYTVDGSANEIGVHAYGNDAPAALAAWRRALGGTWDKGDLSTAIYMSQTIDSLPGSPNVNLYIQKDQCVRKVVGTKEVDVPAVEAQEATTKTVEIVEWDCEPVLSAVAS